MIVIPQSFNEFIKGRDSNKGLQGPQHPSGKQNPFSKADQTITKSLEALKTIGELGTIGQKVAEGLQLVSSIITDPSGQLKVVSEWIDSRHKALDFDKEYSTVGGGTRNPSACGAIFGGCDNIASGQCATVSGGICNCASGSHSVALGRNNRSIVSGGRSSSHSAYSTIGGGTISGGYLNNQSIEALKKHWTNEKDARLLLTVMDGRDFIWNAAGGRIFQHPTVQYNILEEYSMSEVFTYSDEILRAIEDGSIMLQFNGSSISSRGDFYHKLGNVASEEARSEKKKWKPVLEEEPAPTPVNTSTFGIGIVSDEPIPDPITTTVFDGRIDNDIDTSFE